MKKAAKLNSPYKIDRPGVVLFSGGLTSGYMLWHILDAYGGKLPDGIKVIFNNTGKERAETLTFVERCAVEWGVDITWLEYRYRGKFKKTLKNGKIVDRHRHDFEQVNYATASRNGEPFEAAIRARNMLPNVVARFCTVECKILTTTRYLKTHGWKHWTNAIGLRADEPHRVAKLKTTNRHGDEDPVVPLYEAGVSRGDVNAWWKRQPFTLNLQEHEGNCDLCFLKGPGKIRRIMQDRPDLADWWIRMETVIKGGRPEFDRFWMNRPRYSVQLELAQRPGLFDDVTDADELSIACHCTD